MGTMISSGIDVVSFLKEQHEEIKTLFEDVIDANGQERNKCFYQLRRLLAVHETAEEEIVHPAVRSSLPDGEQIIEARLREENEAKRMLADLEGMDLSSAEFETKFLVLEAAVLAHAKAEETQEFGRLANVLDRSRLEGMQKAVKLAEAIAPTRPHAGVESALGNLLVGPFASMVDRARDAMTGKS